MNEYANLLPPLYGFGEVIRETPPLARVIQPIIPRPPLWALLIPPRIDVSFARAKGELSADVRPLPALTEGREAYLLPVSIAFNKDPMIECVLSVASPSPPFHLCAGIVAVDGVQVKDPSCKFTMRLLAARRAPAAGPVADKGVAPQ